MFDSFPQQYTTGLILIVPYMLNYIMICYNQHIEIWNMVRQLIEGQISSCQLRKVLCGKGLMDFQLSGFTDFSWSWLTGRVRNNPFTRSMIMV